MFFIPITIPEIAASTFFPVTVWTPGGTAIIFAQSWNFELKFFVGNTFMQKINSTGVRSHFLPKKCSKEHKTKIQKLYQCLVKD